MKQVAISLVLLVFGLYGQCQQASLPSAPVPQIQVAPDHFLNSQNFATFSASAASIGTEAVLSCDQQTTGVPLPTKTCEEIYIGAGATLSAEVVAAWAFHKSDHHSLEHATPFFGMVFHIGRIVWISTHRK